MATVDVTLRADTGGTTTTRAELTRPEDGARIGKSVGLMLGGVLLAIPFLFVPGVHLFTTWALPLAGAIAAYSTFRTRAKLGRVEGTCPACQAAITLEGGRVTEKMYDDCPQCSRPLQLLISEDPA
ncbi:MAG: hypothetical protein H6739_18550 [Alphaproteobacteria bacterium]|nr:hypothetical protein [Alphaproteobacteria bacterium]